MNTQDILSATYTVLSKLSRNRLLMAIQSLREKYIKLEEKNNEFEAEIEKLKEELKKSKIKSVNTNANKPSSKQAEWDKKGVGNDGKGRGKKPRKGAGNHRQIRVGITQSRYRIEQYDTDLLPVGGLVLTVHQDQRLFEDIFWKRYIDIGAFTACDSGFQDNERRI